jgi:hypothetical protein
MFMELTLMTYLGIMGLIPLNENQSMVIEIGSVTQMNTVSLWIEGVREEGTHKKKSIPVCLLFEQEDKSIAESAACK